jgi:hypothetical protein
MILEAELDKFGQFLIREIKDGFLDEFYGLVERSGIISNPVD